MLILGKGAVPDPVQSKAVDFDRIAFDILEQASQSVNRLPAYLKCVVVQLDVMARL